ISRSFFASARPRRDNSASSGVETSSPEARANSHASYGLITQPPASRDLLSEPAGRANRAKRAAVHKSKAADVADGFEERHEQPQEWAGWTLESAVYRSGKAALNVVRKREFLSCAAGALV